jgi:hypothetical protein
MTDEEFKRQHREISIRAAQERPPPMPTYSIEYCFNEGTKLRSIPLMGSLEQTIRVTGLDWPDAAQTSPVSSTPRQAQKPNWCVEMPKGPQGQKRPADVIGNG